MLEACSKNKYKDQRTGQCKELPLKIKNFEMERHESIKHLDWEIDFWRNQLDKGWVEVTKVEPGAPAWESGKNRFSIQMNTPTQLKSVYVRNLDVARGIAVDWMKRYQEGELFKRRL